MTEESGSILGGLGEAAGAAWDAASSAAGAVSDAASAGVSEAERFGDNVMATGNEFVGDTAARDDWDARGQANAADGSSSWDSAGDNAQRASDDVFGKGTLDSAGDAAGRAWDAAGNSASDLGSAAYDAGSAAASFGEGIYDVYAATGNEFIGDTAARDAADASAIANRDAAEASLNQAGQDLQNASDDVF